MAELVDVLPTGERIHPHQNLTRELHEKSLEDPDGFWHEVADELFWYRRTGPRPRAGS